jgi:6-pyruvoyltetrahydropterin/6-carboxytetrahydropterin synthase
MESWSIVLEKEYFKFSCAHFLIFEDGSKERLHGHNYHVQVEIEGDLSDKGLVIDFLDAKPVVRELCDSLDEHWLVPGEHPELKVEHRDDGHTSVVYREERYLVPTPEIIVLPVNNTSVENLATWFGRELERRLVEHFGQTQVRRLRVAISETPGQRGTYEIRS